MLAAVTVVAGLEAMAVVRQPIEQCRGQRGIAEHGRPFCDAQVGGDDQAGLLVELGKKWDCKAPPDLLNGSSYQ